MSASAGRRGGAAGDENARAVGSGPVSSSHAFGRTAKSSPGRVALAPLPPNGGSGSAGVSGNKGTSNTRSRRNDASGEGPDDASVDSARGKRAVEASTSSAARTRSSRGSGDGGGLRPRGDGSPSSSFSTGMAYTPAATDANAGGATGDALAGSGGGYLPRGPGDGGAREGGSSLHDLASEDKRKVAKLIRQVVEYAEARKALEEELRGARAEAQRERGTREAAEAAAVDGLDEITSLRAKLSNAFALIRSYQRKTREAQRAGLTPGGGETNDDDVAAALGAAALASLLDPEQQCTPGPEATTPAIHRAADAAAEAERRELMTDHTAVEAEAAERAAAAAGGAEKATPAGADAVTAASDAVAASGGDHQLTLPLRHSWLPPHVGDKPVCAVDGEENEEERQEEMEMGRRKQVGVAAAEGEGVWAHEPREQKPVRGHQRWAVGIMTDSRAVADMEAHGAAAGCAEPQTPRATAAADVADVAKVAEVVEVVEVAAPPSPPSPLVYGLSPASARDLRWLTNLQAGKYAAVAGGREGAEAGATAAVTGAGVAATFNLAAATLSAQASQLVDSKEVAAVTDAVGPSPLSGSRSPGVGASPAQSPCLMLSPSPSPEAVDVAFSSLSRDDDASTGVDSGSSGSSGGATVTVPLLPQEVRDADDAAAAAHLLSTAHSPSSAAANDPVKDTVAACIAAAATAATGVDLPLPLLSPAPTAPKNRVLRFDSSVGPAGAFYFADASFSATSAGNVCFQEYAPSEGDVDGEGGREGDTSSASVALYRGCDAGNLAVGSFMPGRDVMATASASATEGDTSSMSPAAAAGLAAHTLVAGTSGLPARAWMAPSQAWAQGVSTMCSASRAAAATVVCSEAVQVAVAAMAWTGDIQERTGEVADAGGVDFRETSFITAGTSSPRMSNSDNHGGNKGEVSTTVAAVTAAAEAGDASRSAVNRASVSAPALPFSASIPSPASVAAAHACAAATPIIHPISNFISSAPVTPVRAFDSCLPPSTSHALPPFVVNHNGEGRGFTMGKQAESTKIAAASSRQGGGGVDADGGGGGGDRWHAGASSEGHPATADGAEAGVTAAYAHVETAHVNVWNRGMGGNGISLVTGCQLSATQPICGGGRGDGGGDISGSKQGEEGQAPPSFGSMSPGAVMAAAAPDSPEVPTPPPSLMFNHAPTPILLQHGPHHYQQQQQQRWRRGDHQPLPQLPMDPPTFSFGVPSTGGWGASAGGTSPADFAQSGTHSAAAAMATRLLASEEIGAWGEGESGEGEERERLCSFDASLADLVDEVEAMKAQGPGRGGNRAGPHRGTLRHSLGAGGGGGGRECSGGSSGRRAGGGGRVTGRPPLDALTRSSRSGFSGSSGRQSLDSGRQLSAAQPIGGGGHGQRQPSVSSRPAWHMDYKSFTAGRPGDPGK